MNQEVTLGAVSHAYCLALLCLLQRAELLTKEEAAKIAAISEAHYGVKIYV